MKYSTPAVLNSMNAKSCIQGIDKQDDANDNGNLGVQGTSTAYQADE